MVRQLELSFEEDVPEPIVVKAMDLTPAPDLFFNHDWLTFTAGTDGIEAARRFRERFGCEPRYSWRRNGLLWVGPVGGVAPITGIM